MTSLADLNALINSVPVARYSTAVALTSLLWEHLITFEEELRVIWFRRGGGNLNRATFFVQRYVTEAVALYVAYMFGGLANGLTDIDCRRFIWVFTIAATVVVDTSQFIIVLRLYRMWDDRMTMSAALIVIFILAISAVTALAIVTAAELQSTMFYFAIIQTCGFLTMPKTLSYLLSVLLALDFFLLTVAVFNAIKGPHRSNADIVKALRRDGARLLAILTVLKAVPLITSVVSNPADVFGVLTIAWALSAIIGSRIHLRVEGLLVWGSQQSFLAI